jgi:hypothetical protein
MRFWLSVDQRPGFKAFIPTANQDWLRPFFHHLKQKLVGSDGIF